METRMKQDRAKEFLKVVLMEKYVSFEKSEMYKALNLGVPAQMAGVVREMLVRDAVEAIKDNFVLVVKPSRMDYANAVVEGILQEPHSRRSTDSPQINAS